MPSQTARRAMYARDGGGEVFLDLLRIHHSTWTQGPMRFVNNTKDVASRGATYAAAPFDIPIPSQLEAGEPTVTIVLYHSDRQIEAELAGLVSEPRITYECIMASAPDTVIYSYTMLLRNAVTTRNSITGTLGGFNPILTKGFPREKFNGKDFPGLAGHE